MIKASKRLYAAMSALELASRALDQKLRLLIQLRASALNHCNFCFTMHAKEAQKLGFSQSWIDSIQMYPKKGGFSHKEQLLLDFTTAATDLTLGPVSPELIQEVVEVFGAKTAGDILTMVTTINAWNRIGVIAKYDR
ncbi:carboxymuconolactone decarboxylase family protein [Corynebacterium freiburgense]|uniref:carboxymuconolactone decarboxylase family protein n=1 Tax=Corynebacterium freiburgense TaxID=556548 RepID=UPI00041D535F|nr:carboxymuconolactone decarboxylase family protein [Corynebacterium freiburgense]WJZ02418.1 Carboxymuconolactone decarboxylase family protein [Corynebacterium freiburgense]